MKRLFLIILMFVSISSFASIKPLPWDLFLKGKPKVSLVYSFVGNNYNSDGSDQVEVHLQTDYPISYGTVQFHMDIYCWMYTINWPRKFPNPDTYSWKWVAVNYNVFIPAGSTDGWAYGVLQPGEYADTNNYTIDGPYIQ